MQTMNAMLRVNGSREMTVALYGVTPGEAWLLMHAHDRETKDVFEDAVLAADVDRSKVDERTRLQTKYPEQLKLIESLFPGRTASDIPDEFSELQDVPLEVAAQAKRSTRQAQAEESVSDAGADEGDDFVATRAPAPAVKAKLSKDEARGAFGGKRK